MITRTGNLKLCRSPQSWPYATSDGCLLIFRLDGCEDEFSLFLPVERYIFLAEEVMVTVHAVPSENGIYEVVAFNVHPERRICIVQHPKSAALRYMFHIGLFGGSIICIGLAVILLINYFGGESIDIAGNKIVAIGCLMFLLIGVIALPLAYRKGLRHHQSRCSWIEWRALRERLLIEHQEALFELQWRSLFSRE